MGENLELGTSFRVLVVKERRRMESWVRCNWIGVLDEIGYSVSVFMMDGLNVIIVLWNVATLMPTLQH